MEKLIDATASALLVFLDTSPFLSSYQGRAPSISKVSGGRMPGGNSFGYSTSWQRQKPCGNSSSVIIQSIRPVHATEIRLNSSIACFRFCARITWTRTSVDTSTTFNISRPIRSIISCLGWGPSAAKADGAAPADTACRNWGLVPCLSTADRLRVEFYDADGNCLYNAGKWLSSLAGTFSV